MSTTSSIETAITSLLHRVPDTWQTFDLDSLSVAESDALLMLVAAGMVERRFELRLRMINHPLTMHAKAVATGEAGLVEALDRVIAGIWRDWRQSYEEWKRGETCDSIPFVCERIGDDEWRLTKYGLLARDDLSNGNASTVFDYVIKRGYFTSRYPCPGSGRLLTFDKVSEIAQESDPVSVRVNNWDECANVFTQLFERYCQTRRESTDGPPVKSGLPNGHGSGAIFNDKVAEYIEQRRQHYDRLVEDTLKQNDGARERFEAMFGPIAIARYWLREWVEELTAQLDDAKKRKRLIKKEENRVAGAIKRQPQYKQRIKPPRNGRKPKDWAPPVKGGEAMNLLLAEVLERKQAS